MFSLVSILPSTTSAGGRPAFVRLLRRYYDGVRLPAAVHVGLICFWLSPTGPQPFSKGRPRGLSVLAHDVSRRAWGLRLRRACIALAITCTAVLSSGSFYPVDALNLCFRSSMASPPIPLSNASSASLRSALAWLGAKMGRYSFLV
jgi:hypothetical protein